MSAPAARRLPPGTTVVDVFASRFLLEWLDFDVLAAAAAARLGEPGEPPRDGRVPSVSAG